MIRYGKRILIFAALLLGAGSVTAGNRMAASAVRRTWMSIRGVASKAQAPGLTPSPRPAPEAPPSIAENAPWDGTIALDARQEAAIGLKTEEAKPKTTPVILELLGTTAHDPDSLVKVRPRFDSLVSKVHATLGQTVHKGDPLIDLYSAQLAEAKSAFEEKFAQWEHDRRQLERHRALVAEKAISEKQHLDTVNEERKSNLEYKLARDKLMIYGLSDDEIGRIHQQDGSQKARMTLHASADGVVIARDAVPGNLYDVTSTLMVIAPLDHLWVWGNVYENDIDKVKVGQTLEVQFPYLDERIRGRVDSIASQVDPGTHAVRVRASIPNPDGRLKSDMLVRTMLEIPAEPGWISVPRVAMVTSDGGNYVFVRRPGPEHRYERRAVEVVQERNDRVVVRAGLSPGDVVVTTGSLLLSQLYEDQSITHGDSPR